MSITSKGLVRTICVAGIVVTVAACGQSQTASRTPITVVTRTVMASPTLKPPPKPVVTFKPKPKPAANPVQQVTADGTGYLGSGAMDNPCSYASGYTLVGCNPEGETKQEYIDDPGGPAPDTSVNTHGCYYVRMGEGYCPATGQDTPMADPNQ